MKAKVYITLKPGVLDPQGKAIAQSLKNQGLNGISGVRQGKYIELELDAPDQVTAEKMVEQACADLLANTVIEEYRFEIAA